MERQKKSYPNLDLAKFICSLLVVVIHTSPFAENQPEISFFLVNVLARTAVPLFFVMSGFFLTAPPCKENSGRFLRYWKKIAVLYGGWSLAYIVIVKIPLWYTTGWWGLHVIPDALAAFLFTGTHYHLWYLLALVYAVPVLVLLLRHLPEKVWTLVAAVLWLCECLTYSYTWLGADHAAPVVWISQRMPIVFDAAFRALPLMLLGSHLARNKPRPNKKRFVVLLVCGILYVAEVYALRSVTESLSYVIFTPVLTVCVFALLLTSRQCSLPPACGAMLRFTSTVMYCVHPMILELLPLEGVSGILRWLTAVILCVILSLALILGRKKLSRK